MNTKTVLKFSIPPILAISTYPVTIGYVIANIDATGYLLEFLATHPVHRERQEIVMLFLCRVVVHLIVTTEAFRAIAFAIGFALILVGRVKNVMVTLLQTKIFSLYLRFYRQTVLIYKTIYLPIQVLLYITLTIIFWLVVYLVWACVKFSRKEVSSFIYYWLVLLLLCVLIIGYIGFTELCVMMELSKQTVVIQKLRARMLFLLSPSRNRKLNYLHGRSIYPFKISYGFFGWLCRDFVCEFAQALTLRCFDMIIMF